MTQAASRSSPSTTLATWARPAPAWERRAPRARRATPEPPDRRAQRAQRARRVVLGPWAPRERRETRAQQGPPAPREPSATANGTRLPARLPSRTIRGQAAARTARLGTGACSEGRAG